MTTSNPSIKALQDNLKSAAAELTTAYALEVEQNKMPGIAPIPAFDTPLQPMLDTLLYQGSLDSLMSSSLIRGNQSKAAQVLGINRATLRNRLKAVGLLTQRRRLSEAELAARMAKEAA